MKELLGFIFSLFLCVFVFAFCHIFSVLFFSSVVFLSFFFFASRLERRREIIFCDQIGSTYLSSVSCSTKTRVVITTTGEKTRDDDEVF